MTRGIEWKRPQGRTKSHAFVVGVWGSMCCAAVRGHEPTEATPDDTARTCQDCRTRWARSTGAEPPTKTTKDAGDKIWHEVQHVHLEEEAPQMVAARTPREAVERYYAETREGEPAMLQARRSGTRRWFVFKVRSEVVVRSEEVAT